MRFAGGAAKLAAPEEEAAPAVDVADLVALAALQHGLKHAVDEQREAVTAAAAKVWEQSKVAPTYRHQLGTVSLRVPKDSIGVDDPEELLDWVLEHHPEEVEVITQVRPAFVTALVGRLVIRDGKILDKETGELVEIPGVSILKGGTPSSIGVTLTADTKSEAEVMVRARLAQLAALSLPFGEGGEDD